MPCLVSLLSTTTSTGILWVCRRFWPLRGFPLEARVSHAPSGKVPTPPSASGSLLCLFLFFWAYLFYFLHGHPCNQGVWVLMTQYTLQITFNGDLGFVASVSRAKGLAFLEALPPRTFVFRFVLGLPSPFVFYFVFYLLM
jgi:hypothetical protein